MKRIFFIMLAAAIIGGCGGLISVGHENNNTIYNYKKEK
ncbi:Uncharacterised protein [Campylobacter geochelonis]|uniref:Lipoprotein n=1 Tax=Campylobacter geochelonis TaxID=1780362 RepID=A0A128EER6_9BACT|nr:Uncharacterised protein [Campylobacter geochelonis]CZE51577.1 Uncharacterised protein [Campylobacter geochelonis]